MTITFAGVDLAVPPAELVRWVEAAVRPEIVYDFDPYYDPVALGCLPVPGPYRLPLVRLGRLFWPTGASRWGVFHTLAAGETVDRLRSAGSGAGLGGSGAGVVGDDELVLADGVGGEVRAVMELLPPKPVSAVADTLVPTPSIPPRYRNELYLLTFVDARFRWWFKQADTTATTWPALFEQLLTAVGIAPSGLGSLGSLYPAPKNRWRIVRRPLPLLLDAACYAVGRRLVRRLDGVVEIQDWAGARTLSAAEWVKVRPADATATPTVPIHAGGLVDSPDLQGHVPEAFELVYGEEAGQVVPVSLAGLAMPEYDGAAGRPGERAAFRTDEIVGTDLPPAITAIAAAKDWYGWQLADVDAVFSGIVPWRVTGWADFLAWEIAAHEGPDGRGECRTTVRRPPWPLGAARGQCRGETGSGAGDRSFLVLITDKDYSGPFIKYSGVRVTDSGAIVYTPTTEFGECGSGGGSGPVDCFNLDRFGPAFGGCCPIYHHNNYDLPVYRNLDLSGSGSGSGAFVPPECVHRVWKGTGDWLFMGQAPVWAFFVRDPSKPQLNDGLGHFYDQGYWLYYDQYDKEVKVKRTSFGIDFGNFTP